MAKYIPEPFRIKMVEPIKKTTREEREEILKKAHYNMFNIPGDKVYIDLLTDSGTNAMSDIQWSGVMVGDEAYAGGKSYFKLVEAGKDIVVSLKEKGIKVIVNPDADKSLREPNAFQSIAASLFNDLNDMRRVLNKRSQKLPLLGKVIQRKLTR